jgi:uncharacterized CHY-type Zn-finger protein
LKGKRKGQRKEKIDIDITNDMIGFAIGSPDLLSELIGVKEENCTCHEMDESAARPTDTICIFKFGTNDDGELRVVGSTCIGRWTSICPNCAKALNQQIKKKLGESCFSNVISNKGKCRKTRENTKVISTGDGMSVGIDDFRTPGRRMAIVSDGDIAFVPCSDFHHFHTCLYCEDGAEHPVKPSTTKATKRKQAIIFPTTVNGLSEFRISTFVAALEGLSVERLTEKAVSGIFVRKNEDSEKIVKVSVEEAALMIAALRKLNPGAFQPKRSKQAKKPAETSEVDHEDL